MFALPTLSHKKVSLTSTSARIELAALYDNALSLSLSNGLSTMEEESPSGDISEKWREDRASE